MTEHQLDAVMMGLHHAGFKVSTFRGQETGMEVFPAKEPYRGVSFRLYSGETQFEPDRFWAEQDMSHYGFWAEKDLDLYVAKVEHQVQTVVETVLEKGSAVG